MISVSWQVIAMMTSEECWLKSALCDVNADQSRDPATRATWLRLARDWRDMAGDADARGTTARLMDRTRAANGDVQP